MTRRLAWGLFLAIGCGGEAAPASTSDAAADTASFEVATDSGGGVDVATDAPPSREETSLTTYGCPSRKAGEPPAKGCGCTPGTLSVELEGDGDKLVLGTAYAHPQNDVCAAEGPALYTLGGCPGQALFACASAASGGGCLLLAEPPRGGEKWVRGHYVDRKGECFELRDTVLDVATDGKSGSVSTGTFKATAVGSRTLTLSGRFSACTARKIITCE